MSRPAPWRARWLQLARLAPGPRRQTGTGRRPAVACQASIVRHAQPRQRKRAWRTCAGGASCRLARGPDRWPPAPVAPIVSASARRLPGRRSGHRLRRALRAADCRIAMSRRRADTGHAAGRDRGCACAPRSTGWMQERNRHSPRLRWLSRSIDRRWRERLTTVCARPGVRPAPAIASVAPGAPGTWFLRLPIAPAPAPTTARAWRRFLPASRRCHRRCAPRWSRGSGNPAAARAGAVPVPGRQSRSRGPRARRRSGRGRSAFRRAGCEVRD